MNLKKYAILISTCLSVSLNAQTQTPEQLKAAIEAKEQASLYYQTLRTSGSGGNPTTQSSPEQDCNSAIPVCQNVYTTSTSYSGVGANDEIPGNTCLSTNERNSVWYTFNTSSSGNLAFNITPNSSSDDYDFALYDITGSNCAGIANGAITPIRCNYSATAGQTGLSSSGTIASEPAGGSNQSTVLATTSGHTYVLIISNYSSSQSGYTLDFSPGTASIFDVTPPTPTGVTAPCGSNVLTLNVSEQIKCSSIASNGSDFTLTGTGGPYTITGSTGVNCGTNTGQVTFTCTPAISGAGPWTLGIVSGSDGNTLIDACGNAMAAQTKTFTTVPATPVITGPTSVCKGSIFALSSSPASSYTWTGVGVPAGQQNHQTLTINSNSSGNYTFNLTVSNGVCGNSSSSISVTIKDAPIAAFTGTPSFTICAGQTISFVNSSTQSTISVLGFPQSVSNLYYWSFGDIASGGSNISTSTNPSHTYNNPGTYNVGLTASPVTQLAGLACSNTITHDITVLLAAANLTISPSTTICPGQSATLTAQGAASYTWANASTLNTANGGTVIATPASNTTYTVSSPGCGSTSTATTQVTVNGAPPAIGTVNGLGTVCANQTGVTYSVANVASANYSWTVPAGATITSAPTNSNAITVDFGATAGSITAVAATACGSATSIVVVNVSASPSLVMPANATVCPNSTITLGVSGGGTYTWSPAGSVSSVNGNTVTSTPSVTTVYSVSSMACGSPVTGTVEITVSGAAPSIGLIDGNLVLCNSAKTGITYSVINVPGATYSWTVPSGATITSTPLNSNSITVNYGTSSGSLIVTANTACGSATSIATMTIMPNPTITAISNATICTGGSANLTAGGGATFTWSPGGSNNISITVNPTVTTNYTVTGFDGVCTNTASVKVTVVTNPTLTIAPNATVCPNAAHTFTVGGATNYTWTPNTFLNTNTGNSVISTPLSNQVYTVVGSSSGTCSDTKTVSITVSNTVVVTATAANATICPLGNTILTANGAANYTWSPSLTLSSANGANVTATPSSNQTYTVIGASGTCTNSAQVAVTVTTTPVITVSTQTICAGGSTALSASGANSYSWSPNTNLTFTVGANVTANPSQTTIYSITGSNAAGCLGSASTTVNVVQLPNLVVAASPTLICVGATSSLSASGANTYTWSPASSLNTAFGPNVIANPSQSTTYNVLGTNSLGNTSCTSNTIIAVSVMPITVITPSKNDTLCLNDSRAISASGGDTYSWTPSNSLSSPNSAATVAQPITTTIYTVTGSVGGLCPGTATLQLLVNPLPTVYAGRDTTINIDESYVLHGTSNVPVGMFGFLSPDGEPLICHYCPIVEVAPNINTCYTLEAVNNLGCKNTDDVCITVTTNWDVFIPNTFTPNGDIYNEYFIPRGYGIDHINLSIFDRWGVEVFKEANTELGWDGKYKGNICQQGVYIYQAEIITMGGLKVKKTGHVNVLSKIK